MEQIEVFVSAEEIALIGLTRNSGDLRNTPGWEERLLAAGLDPKRYANIMRDIAIKKHLRDQGYPIDREGWAVEWWETAEDSETGAGRHYRMFEMR